MCAHVRVRACVCKIYNIYKIHIDNLKIPFLLVLMKSKFEMINKKVEFCMVCCVQKGCFFNYTKHGEFFFNLITITSLI